MQHAGFCRATDDARKSPYLSPALITTLTTHLNATRSPRQNRTNHEYDYQEYPMTRVTPHRTFGLVLISALASCTSSPDVESADTAELAASHRPPTAPPSQDDFTAFESGQVRPLAISADGRYV